MDMIQGIAFTATALLATIAWWTTRARLLRLRREMEGVSCLVREMNPTDWQRSVHALLLGIVENGLGRSVGLLALTDSGTLETRATASAPGEPGWEGPVADAGAHRALAAKSTVSGADGTVYFPLLDGSEAIGLLAVRGGASDGPALNVAARLGGLALTEIRLNRRQSTLSNTDGLTGLFNHRHFQQMLSIALGQAYLEGEPLSLILLDIDHFKQVNDTYGHLLGDLVLREIANLLRHELPPNGFPARYGGEEFVVVLQGESAHNAPEIAEEIRKRIEEREVVDFSSGVHIHVTVSLGVAAYELGQGKNRLIARADEAHYASKRAGRNRVTVADPESVTIGQSQAYK